MVRQSTLDIFSWHLRSWEEIKGAFSLAKWNYTNLGICFVLLLVAIFQARNGLVLLPLKYQRLRSES